ncbi:hypothetical protein JHK87_004303 [Glycine soja]|nr:hypothetical protein JHK87_004303 [Glycine soja]
MLLSLSDLRPINKGHGNLYGQNLSGRTQLFLCWKVKSCWLVELEIMHAITELDCKGVVDRIERSNQDVSDIGAITKDCKAILDVISKLLC